MSDWEAGAVWLTVDLSVQRDERWMVTDKSLSASLAAPPPAAAATVCVRACVCKVRRRHDVSAAAVERDVIVVMATKVCVWWAAATLWWRQHASLLQHQLDGQRQQLLTLSTCYVIAWLQSDFTCKHSSQKNCALVSRYIFHGFWTTSIKLLENCEYNRSTDDDLFLMQWNILFLFDDVILNVHFSWRI